MIKRLKRLQLQKTDILWMIRFRNAALTTRAVYIMTTCKCCVARIFAIYTDWTVDQLQAKLVDIEQGINEITESVSLDELKEIL